MLPLILFYAMAFVAILFAVILIVHRNPVVSAVSLVVTVCALAVIYFQLGAPFIGALQVIVYAGAIIVLFLFVIMLLNLRAEDPSPEERPIQRAISYLAFFVMLVALAALVNMTPLNPVRPMLPDPTAELARQLFTAYLFPFEAVTVLLMAAVVGAFMLGGGKKS